MDTEERIFKALGGEKADRVPTFSLIGDPNVANQVLGREPDKLFLFRRFLHLEEEPVLALLVEVEQDVSAGEPLSLELELQGAALDGGRDAFVRLSLQ